MPDPAHGRDPRPADSVAPQGAVESTQSDSLGHEDGGEAPSGFFYTQLTRHWPRIAVALVFLIGVGEWVVEGLTAGGALQYYLMAWAATTSGLWFIFEKAEKALSAESREAVASRLFTGSISESIATMPRSFEMLVDRVFGKRHLSVRCFVRSSAASVVGVGIVLGLWIAFHSPVVNLATYQVDLPFSSPPTTRFGEIWPEYAHALAGVELQAAGERVLDVLGLLRGASTVLLFAILLNLIPDFISLWETRVVLGWMAKRGSHLRGLILDLVLTTVISGVAVFGGCWAFFGQSPLPDSQSSIVRPSGYSPDPPWLRELIGSWRIERVTYPTSRVGVLLAVGGDLTRLAPRFGTLMVPVVPTVDHVHVDASLGREWTQANAHGADGGVPVLAPRVRWDDQPVAGDWSGSRAAGAIGLPFGLFFYSAFFTSAWLWVYVGSVILSRVLTRVGRGVGLLLRLTDVQRQPFTSIGFASVILVSLVFLAGLPLVLFH